MKLRKVSAVLLATVLVSASSIITYAAKEVTITKIGNRPTVTGDYAKEIDAEGCLVYITDATHPQYSTTFQVFKKDDTAVTDARRIENYDRIKNRIVYKGSYGKKDFKAHLIAHDTDYTAPNYSVVTARWNPNG